MVKIILKKKAEEQVIRTDLFLFLFFLVFLFFLSLFISRIGEARPERAGKW